MRILQVLLLSSLMCSDDFSNSSVEAEFSPSVSATCRAGVMNIKVETNINFLGAVHARDYRRPACTNYGQGTSSTSLKINLLADQNTAQYCGVFVNKVIRDFVNSFDKLKWKQITDSLSDNHEGCQQKSGINVLDSF